MRTFYYPSERWYISQNTEPVLNLCCHLWQQHWSATWEPTSRKDALLPQQDLPAIQISWQDSSQTVAEGKEQIGQHYWVWGVTHLTTDADQKLLWLHYPNSHLRRMLRTGGSRRGEREEQNKIIKIIKDRSRGMAIKPGAKLNDVC